MNNVESQPPQPTPTPSPEPAPGPDPLPPDGTPPTHPVPQPPGPIAEARLTRFENRGKHNKRFYWDLERR